MYKNAGYTGIVITDHYYKGFFNSLNNNTWAEKVDVSLLAISFILTVKTMVLKYCSV